MTIERNDFAMRVHHGTHRMKLQNYNHNKCDQQARINKAANESDSEKAKSERQQRQQPQPQYE